MSNKKKWYQQATTWTGIMTIAGAAAGIATKQIDPVQGAMAIAGGGWAQYLCVGRLKE